MSSEALQFIHWYILVHCISIIYAANVQRLGNCQYCAAIHLIFVSVTSRQ